MVQTFLGVFLFFSILVQLTHKPQKMKKICGGVPIQARNPDKQEKF